MVVIRQADPLGDAVILRALWSEYLSWGNEQVAKHYEFSLPITDMLEGVLADLSQFAPPHGRLLLGVRDGRVEGVGCLRRLSADVAEVKRMYVRPDAHGTGVGRALLDALIFAARDESYRVVRLDTGGFMEVAQHLYRSAGFEPIEPYVESEVPPELHPNWRFFEKRLP